MAFRPSLLALGLFASLAAAAPRDDAAARAVAAWRAGDLSAARDIAGAAARADPNWALGQALYARMLIARGQGTDAEAALGRALDRGYRKADLTHLLAEAKLIQNDPAGALTVLKDPVASRYAAYAMRIKGRALLASGDREAAGRTLDAAQRIDPDNAALWVAAAQLRLAQGDFIGAGQAGARAVAVAPNDPAALLVEAGLVRDRYGLAAALPWYDRAVAVDPGNLQAHLDRAATLGDLARASDCLAETRAALALVPDNPVAFYLQSVIAARAGRWELARVLLARTGGRIDGYAGVRLVRAAAELNGGSLETAIAQARALAVSQPGNAPARRLLGLALWRGGDAAGTLDALGPLTDSYSLSLAARAYARTGDRAKAAEMRALLANLTPPAFDGSRRGDAAYAAGHWADAAQAYRADANARLSRAAALRLAAALARSGLGGAANIVIDTFLEQYPLDPPALALAGTIATDGRDWRRAGVAFGRQRALIGDGDALLDARLGWALVKLGRREEGIALLRRAAALAPQVRGFAAKLAEAKAAR